jgi:hypothetical protein
MSANTLAMDNVVIGEDMKKFTFDAVHSKLEPVVNRLATLNPRWIFIAVGRTGSGGSNVYRASAFEVRMDNEVLGNIGLVSSHTKGTLITVSNDRISAKRQRSNAYRTEDPDKAILAAKKSFGRMNVNERIDKAAVTASDTMSKASWNKERQHREHWSIVIAAMSNWARNEGQLLFLEFAKSQMAVSEAKRVLEAHEKSQVLNMEMKSIAEIQKLYGKGETLLVVKDGDKYVARMGDKVDMYDDTTLPMDTRMKLGMLKLVGDGEFITEVGCRVSSEIFVLQADLTNVSQGE